MKKILLVAMTIVLAGACGTGDGDGASAADESGVLVVERAAGGTPIGVEGSVAFARVTASDGTVVWDEGFDAPGRRDQYPPSLELELDPGTYTLTAYQRTCDGSCDNLDGPAEGYTCETELDVEPEASMAATVTIEDKGCTVTLAG